MRFIPSPNFNERPCKINAVVIHYTSSPDLGGTISWFRNPQSRASAHYVIDRDGTIIQMVKDEDRAWHAGKSSLHGQNNVNDFSIGIELVNWGLLKYRDRKFFCWPSNYKRIYNITKFGSPKKVGNEYWAPYPNAQIVACAHLCNSLRSKYSIESKNIVRHSDISPGRKRDPGPHFPLDKVIYESDPLLNLHLYSSDINTQELLLKSGDRAEIKSSFSNIIERLQNKLSWISLLRTK